MLSFDLCKQSKPDVQQRPLLRVFDKHGQRTVDPFTGKLCEHCCEEAQKMNTPEHMWVLAQIAKTPRRGRG